MMSKGDTPWDPAELPRLRSDLAGLTEDMDRWGYCIIENALTSDGLDRVSHRLREQAREEKALGLGTTYQADPEGEHNNQWLYALVNKGREFWDLPMHPTMRALARHVLGEAHMLSAYDSHITYPSNQQMALHTDQWWMPQPVLPGERHWRVGDMGRGSPQTGEPSIADRPIAPPMVLNVMWMLCDFTDENGATRMVPGSHLSGMQPDAARDDYPTVVIEAPAGTALAWEGRTWHAAGLNRTRDPRYGVVTLYAAPCVRQLCNFPYALRPEVKAQMPEELLALLGLRPWESYGMTDDPIASIALGGEDVLGRLGD